MPKSKRDRILMRHDQIIGHLEKAIVFTDKLEEMFKTHHPEYSDGYATICVMLAQTLEFVKKMRSFV